MSGAGSLEALLSWMIWTDLPLRVLLPLPGGWSLIVKVPRLVLKRRGATKGPTSFPRKLRTHFSIWWGVGEQDKVLRNGFFFWPGSAPEFTHWAGQMVSSPSFDSLPNMLRVSWSDFSAFKSRLLGVGRDPIRLSDSKPHALGAWESDGCEQAL